MGQEWERGGGIGVRSSKVEEAGHWHSSPRLQTSHMCVHGLSDLLCPFSTPALPCNRCNQCNPCNLQAAAGSYQISVKATLGMESKFIYASLNISYAELLDHVRQKFPGSGEGTSHTLVCATSPLNLGWIWWRCKGTVAKFLMSSVPWYGRMLVRRCKLELSLW